ncbi:hypothetical protein GIY62_34110 [Burkholderia plantarii]|uniref:hypothetical protein n=1 Tax=Burkholderia plantarii TaxID=41899 RepID=UPI000F511623|nr:hypothetical protein [Burkholderia plantarii]WLE62418.1 hypothetical protein GIY62_34110 [Burkholderia plantarii]
MRKPIPNIMKASPCRHADCRGFTKSGIRRNQAVPNKKYKKSFCFFDTTTGCFECHFYFRRSKMRPVANSVNRAGLPRQGRPASLSPVRRQLTKTLRRVANDSRFRPFSECRRAPLPAQCETRITRRMARPANSGTVIVQLEPFR